MTLDAKFRHRGHLRRGGEDPVYGDLRRGGDGGHRAAAHRFSGCGWAIAAIGPGPDAPYISGSGTTALVFEYTVLATDEDDNGIWIEADAVRLNGGTIKDSDDNDADLTHAQPGGQSSHKVDGSLNPPDTTAPTVSSAEVAAAAPKQLVITFDEPLDTTAAPAASAFTVKVGGTAEPQPAAVSISGSAVTLTLAVALDSSQSNVTVDYTNPGTSNDPLKTPATMRWRPLPIGR